MKAFRIITVVLVLLLSTQTIFAGRYYDSATGRFISVDPKADNYPGLSPYSYAANNPLYYTDPNGMEIRIYTGQYDDDGNEKYVTYTAGMEYKGDNKFVSKVIGALNNMNGVDIGAEVLGSLISSDNSFNFKNMASAAEGTVQFLPSSQGGGDIAAAAMLSNNYNESTNLEIVSHELFHGYQHDNGGVFGANSEVEAYLFGRAVSANFQGGYFGTFGGSNTSEGRAFAGAMNNMMFDKAFNRTTFNTAAQNFPIGNPYGLYRKSRYYPNFKPLINKFFPLLR